jgi:extradiol dioxygenase family protein
MPAGGEARARYECRDDDEFKDYERMFIFDPFDNRIELLQLRAASR